MHLYASLCVYCICNNASKQSGPEEAKDIGKQNGIRKSILIAKAQTKVKPTKKLQSEKPKKNSTQTKSGIRLGKTIFRFKIQILQILKNLPI